MFDLRNAYKTQKLILFVGSGISQSLNLPSWNELIDKIAHELGYNPEIYKTFGSNYALAEFYKLVKGDIGPLRSMMDRDWHSPQIKIEDSIIHKLIVSANFPIIYTTNYDRWIEKAFDYYNKKYTKIISVSDITKIKNDQTQIVKFHGDFDADKSIVLTESSYFERLEFETPLDIKLRSDVLGNSVLFIGYSLTDINLRFLFYKLNKLWKSSCPEQIQPQSYIFSFRKNPIQEEILKQWKIKMFSGDGDSPQIALENFLREIFG